MNSEMKISFQGKTALVTGAASGMGLATAKAFAKAGANVVLADINEQAAIAAASDIEKEGFRALGVGCDVSDEAQVELLIQTTVKAFGSLDVAFNNAGIVSPATDTADVRAEDFDRVIAVNLRGVWLCMKYELLHMRRQQSGAIVNCSSISGLIGTSGRAAYSAAKHGVLGLTKSVGAEYAAKGIRVNAIAPGTIETPMVQAMVNAGDLSREVSTQLAPIGRLGQDKEIADAVLWLCSSMSTYVIGQSIAVDGGYTVV